MLNYNNEHETLHSHATTVPLQNMSLAPHPLQKTHLLFDVQQDRRQAGIRVPLMTLDLFDDLNNSPLGRPCCITCMFHVFYDGVLVLLYRCFTVVSLCLIGYVVYFVIMSSEVDKFPGEICWPCGRI